jgi:hypothetical protein
MDLSKFKLDEEVYDWDKPYESSFELVSEPLEKPDLLTDLTDDFDLVDLEKGYVEEIESLRPEESFKPKPLPEIDINQSKDTSYPQVELEFNPLAGTIVERIELLKDKIQGLIEDIATRQALNKLVLGRLGSEIAYCGFLLKDMDKWALGVNHSIEFRRTHLFKEWLGLKRSYSEEKIKCWRDLVWLRKELRECVEEYRLIRSGTKNLP